MGKDSKFRLPPTALERVASAFEEAITLYDKVVRDKTVSENLERFDVARDLMVVSDHLRIARHFLVDALTKAARAQADGEDI
jgi:hypothetical protein